MAGSPVVRKVAAAAALPAARPMLMAFLPGKAKGLDASTPCSLPNATAEPACHNKLYFLKIPTFCLLGWAPRLSFVGRFSATYVGCFCWLNAYEGVADLTLLLLEQAVCVDA